MRKKHIKQSADYQSGQYEESNSLTEIARTGHRKARIVSETMDKTNGGRNAAEQDKEG